MSIEKTTFTATEINTSLAEVGAWLTANADVLGFTVSTDTDGSVLCTNAKGTNFLKFTKMDGGTAEVLIVLDNGAKTDVYSNYSPYRWSVGYVCIGGLALYALRPDQSHIWVFISKTESGGLCVVVEEGSTTTVKVRYGDVEKGVKICASGSGDKSKYHYLTDGDAIPRTSFAPFCFDSGDAATALFFTPQTQYPIIDPSEGREMVLTADGKDEYVYSGLIAMKG